MTVNQPTDPLIGRVVDGRYLIVSRIARGGMATVYLANDGRLERRVAIKVMHAHLTDDVAFRDRFIQEARSAARLAHPNVVNVFDQGQEDEMAYLVMEYLPGITLRDLLNEQGRLTSEQTLDITQAVLSGLAAAHRSGIVHRDLKPENVLLADDGRIKIGDFGLARAASAATATGQALLGTVAYLSPELVTRGVADARSDIYAIGIMMFEMLTGQQPFRGDQPMQIAYQHANESVPAPSGINPAVPPELDELVLWATSRDPERRPKDAGMLLEQVQSTADALRTRSGRTRPLAEETLVLPAPTPRDTAVIGTGPTTPVAPATTLAQRARTRRRRGAWLFALVVLAAAAAGGTGWYFGNGPGSLLTVPDVAGLDRDDAAATLEHEGFTVSAQDRLEYSTDVPRGDVIGVRPVAIGEQAERGTTLTLIVSDGREPLDLPPIIGTTEEQARASLEAARLHPAPDTQQLFDDDTEAGIVLRALNARGKSLDDGATVHVGDTITLVVSAGPLPPVQGLTEDSATETLEAVGLRVGKPVLRNDFDIEQGLVIGLRNADNPIAPGDRVRLIVSDGPELTEVPTVDGMIINDAIAQLEAAGWTVEVADSIYNERAYDVIRVDHTEPGAGSDVRADQKHITLVPENPIFGAD